MDILPNGRVKITGKVVNGHIAQMNVLKLQEKW